MPLSVLTGTKLRERRLALGLKQAQVAERAGISASYLNLIEHNRRAVGPKVLERLSAALGLEQSAFVAGSDALMFEALRTAVARTGGTEETSGSLDIDLDRLGDFVSRYPGWAELVVQLDRRAEGLERAVEALSDRMTHDTHLSQSLHELLSALSSVRATAAILAETGDLAPEWTARFHRNLHRDSERLVIGAEALVAYLDAGSSAEPGILSPQEEVEDWLRARNWASEERGVSALALRPETASITSSAARSLALAHLSRTEGDAQEVPLGKLRAGIQSHGPDPFALATAFDCDPMVIMRRLATLADLRAGLVLCDGSGTFTYRKPIVGFPFPRFGAACPLWPLFQALGHPQEPVEAVVEMVGQGGGRHRTFAWATTRRPSGPRGPELREAGMLILAAEPPRAAGVTGAALAVGSSCRVCPRSACAGRREPSILGPEADATREQF
ncbi:MAG: DUF2083 domain-containing protein [Tabrizicola sp.]|nr:DUF2083 domain-containing protein [Tabrizicola sp.]